MGFLIIIILKKLLAQRTFFYFISLLTFPDGGEYMYNLNQTDWTL